MGNLSQRLSKVDEDLKQARRHPIESNARLSFLEKGVEGLVEVVNELIALQASTDLKKLHPLTEDNPPQAAL
jgi:hypothetical protein